jgi:predicted amidohydrolase YtcJ
VSSLTLLHHAVILDHPGADAMVIRGERIQAIGPSEALDAVLPSDAVVERVGLAGRFLMPGFIDAHIHLLQTGLVESGWLVGLAKLPREEALAMLAAAVSERSGGWVIGSGWDESDWPGRRPLSREELDAVAPRAPVLAVRVDGHLLVANSQALRHLPPGTPEGLVDRSQGALREAAVEAMLGVARPDELSKIEALQAAAHLCHRRGITSVHTMTRHEHWEVFHRHREARRLRITFCPEIGALDALTEAAVTTGCGDAWLRYGGVKIFADGSIGAQNAAVSAPYSAGGVGALNHDQTKLRDWVKRADETGWQAIIHAIGDRAIEQVLSVHALLSTDRGLRHRVEHFELPTERQIETTRSLGLFVSMQPNFTANWSGPGSMYEERLGAARDQLSNPLRWVIDRGIPLALGSDGMPPGPIYGLYGAVQGSFPAQRLSMEEALTCYTAGGAEFGFDETRSGHLVPGAWADLVVLDQDPRVDPQNVLDRRVEMTWVGGTRVYKRSGKG